MTRKKKKGRPGYRLAALFMLCLCCCVGGPPPASEVAAERAAWSQVRDITADDAVTEQEKPPLAEAMAAWDAKIATDEAAVARGDTTVQDLIRVYGLATVQVFVGPELQKRAPELFRFIDGNSNGVLEEHELLAVDPRSPVFALVVASTAARLIAERRSG